MASLRMRTVLVLLGLLFPVPQSFVIRKRSVAGYDAAMKDSRSVFSDHWLPTDDDAALMDPYSREPYLVGDPERPDLDLMVPYISSSSDDHYLNDLNDEDEPEEEEEGFDGGYGASLIPDEDDGKGEVDGDGNTKLLNKSELENLFENDSEREKKLMSADHREFELTKDDVEKLLRSPEPSSTRNEVRHKLVTETKILVGSSSNGTSARPSYEGVRVVEVTEQQPNGETRKQKQTDWLRSPDLKQADAPDAPLEGAWSVGSNDGDDPEGAADQQRVRHKVKRSEFSATDDDDDKDLGKTRGISAADDVELLKTYIRLQTEENRHLEQALNLAITTQVENSAEYLNDELGQMRLAVENEDALEAIREAIRRRQPDTGEGEEEEEEEEEDEGDDEDLEGEQERKDDDEGDSDDDEFSKRLLRAKLKKFLIDSAVDELKAAGAEEGELEAGEEEEEEEEDDEEGDQRSSYLYPNAKVLNPFTRNAYGEYGKPKRSEEYEEIIRPDDEDVMLRGTNDVDITDLLDTPMSTEPGGYDYCSPVRELTDRCLVATTEGLALDAEAVSLCNRHQICYLCGSVFGMTSDTCDRGYLGESERLCSGSEQCTREAAGLYLVMAKARRFVSTSVAFGLNDGVCAAECVYDYIIGEADDRR